METAEITINQRQVPAGYVLCFNKECTKREECQQFTTQITATDAEIDRKVLDLSGLTVEERKIVMEA